MKIERLPRALLFVAALLLAAQAWSVAPTPDELAATKQWAAARFEVPRQTPTPQTSPSNGQSLPDMSGTVFSFKYRGPFLG